MNRSSARLLVLFGTVTLCAASLRAAGNEGGLADHQQSMQKSIAKLQRQAAQIQDHVAFFCFPDALTMSACLALTTCSDVP